MDSLFVSKKLITTQMRENSPGSFLFQRGIEYFQQERYNEGIVLLELAGEHLPPDQAHLTDILDMLMQEYIKFAHLQQTLQDVSNQFVEVHSKLEASKTAFNALSSRLLSAQLTPPQKSCTPRYVQSLPEQIQLEEDSNLALYAICLGPFEVRRAGVPLALCSNRNALTMLRYLITQPDHSATTDALMDLLWPEDSVKVALHKLYVTASILRRSLQGKLNMREQYILCKQGCYMLNPALPIRTDADEFLMLYHAGRKAEGETAASYYEIACSLYTRPFLVEDLYADWSFTMREQLRQIHLEMCSSLASYYLEKRCYETAARWATVIVGENRCDEAAHRLLMLIYAREGRRNEAIRQYYLCQQALQDEFNLPPMPETEALYQAIIRGEPDL